MNVDLKRDMSKYQYRQRRLSCLVSLIQMCSVAKDHVLVVIDQRSKHLRCLVHNVGGSPTLSEPHSMKLRTSVGLDCEPAFDSFKNSLGILHGCDWIANMI